MLRYKARKVTFSLEKILKQEGLLILLLTAMWYFIALSYEIGSAAYFGYSVDFINLSIPRLVNITGIWLILFIASTLLFSSYSKGTKLTLGCFSVWILLYCGVVYLSNNVDKSYIVGHLLMIAPAILFVVIRHYFLKQSAINRKIFLILLGLFACFITAYFSGRASSALKSNFFCFENNHRQYALLFASDYFIAAEIINKKITENIIYIPEHEKTTIFLKRISVDISDNKWF